MTAAAIRKIAPQGKSKKKTAILWTVVGLLVIAALVVATIFIIKNIETPEQKVMLQYLENKYNKNFTAGRSVTKGAGLGVEGYQQATAKSVDDSVQFDVYDTQTGMKDDYQSVIWENSQRSTIDSLTKKAVGNLKYDLTLYISPSTDVVTKMGGQTPSYSRAIEEYGQEITYDVTIDIDISAKDYTTDYVAAFGKKLSPLVDYLYDQGVKTIYLTPKFHIIGNGVEYVYTLTGDKDTVLMQSQALKDYLKQYKEE